MKKNANRGVCVEECSIFLLAVALSVCLIGGDVHAQEEQGSGGEMESVEELTAEEMKEKGIPQGGLQISPTKFVWVLNEGDVKTGRVIVKNYSDKAQHVTLEVEDFFVKDDGRTPQLYVPAERDELKALDVIDWFAPPESFDIPAGGAKSVEFTVRVPDGQPTNGYYGSLLFRTGGLEGNNEEEGARVGLSYRIGALVIMAVQGDEPMVVEGEVQDFYPEKNVFWESPAALFVRANNTGNIHYPMFGTIEVDRFGKKFHEIELTARLLYPQKVVDFREIMEFGTWDFGKFDAHLAMRSEDETVQLEADTSFWIIPWRGLIIIGIGIVGFIILVMFLKRYVYIGKKPRKRKK